jgi:hypothetical protein
MTTARSDATFTQRIISKYGMTGDFVRALFERPLAQLRAERRWLTSVIEEVE